MSRKSLEFLDRIKYLVENDRNGEAVYELGDLIRKDFDSMNLLLMGAKLLETNQISLNESDNTEESRGSSPRQQGEEFKFSSYLSNLSDVERSNDYRNEISSNYDRIPGSSNNFPVKNKLSYEEERKYPSLKKLAERFQSSNPNERDNIEPYQERHHDEQLNQDKGKNYKSSIEDIDYFEGKLSLDTLQEKERKRLLLLRDLGFIEYENIVGNRLPESYFRYLEENERLDFRREISFNRRSLQNIHESCCKGLSLKTAENEEMKRLIAEGITIYYTRSRRPHCKLAIIHSDYPKVILTKAQMQGIRNQLSFMKGSYNEFTTTMQKDGWLCVNCENDRTRNWVFDIAPKLKVDNLLKKTIRVIECYSKDRRHVCISYVSAIQIDAISNGNKKPLEENFILRLGKENNLDVSFWKVIHKTEAMSKDYFIFFSISRKSISKLREMKFSPLLGDSPLKIHIYEATPTISFESMRSIVLDLLKYETETEKIYRKRNTIKRSQIDVETESKPPKEIKLELAKGITPIQKEIEKTFKELAFVCWEELHPPFITEDDANLNHQLAIFHTNYPGTTMQKSDISEVIERLEKVFSPNSPLIDIKPHKDGWILIKCSNKTVDCIRQCIRRYNDWAKSVRPGEETYIRTLDCKFIKVHLAIFYIKKEYQNLFIKKISEENDVSVRNWEILNIEAIKDELQLTFLIDDETLNFMRRVKGRPLFYREEINCYLYQAIPTKRLQNCKTRKFIDQTK